MSLAQVPYMFSTPLRSLISKDLTNLFFAGRLASFSHVVFGSQRVQKTCAVTGQAAGTAAAYAISHNTDPIKLKDDKAAVWSIQQQLLRDDAFIIGLLNEDPRDHARLATVTATSENNGTFGAAANVLSGQSRAVVTDLPFNGKGKCGGVPHGQGVPGSNRWISVGLPAALTLKLKGGAPQQLLQAEIVFDTGMHRELDNVGKGQPGPQAETVRDYVIEGRDSATGQWKMLCNVTENYQRKRIHTLPCPIEPPGPPPAPAPPAIAPGAVQASQCLGMDAPTQMWSIDATTGEISTNNGDGASGRLCLGFDKAMLAFGGKGKAVVARTCGGVNSTKWVLKDAHPGSKFISLELPEPCPAPPAYAGATPARMVMSEHSFSAAGELEMDFDSTTAAPPCSTLKPPFCNCTGGAGNVRKCSCAACGKCGCGTPKGSGCNICDGESFHKQTP